jgi:hypothetical protein
MQKQNIQQQKTLGQRNPLLSPKTKQHPQSNTDNSNEPKSKTNITQ